MLGFIWDSCDGNVAEWVKQIKTYVNGKYITWDEFEADALANPDKWKYDPPEPENYDDLEPIDLDFGEVYP
jgi:hypothetical protein